MQVRLSNHWPKYITLKWLISCQLLPNYARILHYRIHLRLLFSSLFQKGEHTATKMEETILKLTTVLGINFSNNANGTQDKATQVAETGEITVTTVSHGDARVSSPSTAGSVNVIDAVRFYCSILGTLFICLGLCGNVLSILVWKRQRMRCSTGTYLIGQAIADICLLVFFFLTESLPSLSPDVTDSYSFGVFFSYVGYPFFYFFLVCSIWFTVGVTIDRFIQIQWPIKGKVRSSGFLYIISITLTSITPQCYCSKWACEYDKKGGKNLRQIEFIMVDCII